MALSPPVVTATRNVALPTREEKNVLSDPRVAYGDHRHRKFGERGRSHTSPRIVHVDAWPLPKETYPVIATIYTPSIPAPAPEALVGYTCIVQRLCQLNVPSPSRV